MDQFLELLGWKRVNKEVSQCYFQATRLIAFVHDELNRLFAHQYVAERAETETGTDKDNDGNHLTATAIGYLKWVQGLKSSSDKWVSICAVFLEMANDYLECVASYRVGDAVMVEYGYQKHTPALEIMGQNKYVEIHWRHQEVLYRNNPLSRLQECRNNRFVRRCDANTGKRCVCQDEFLEHGMDSLACFQCPKPWSHSQTKASTLALV